MVTLIIVILGVTALFLTFGLLEKKSPPLKKPPLHPATFTFPALVPSTLGRTPLRHLDRRMRWHGKSEAV